jgi:hypothetical protein
VNRWKGAGVAAVVSLMLQPLGAIAADDVPAPTVKAGDSWVFNHLTERGTTGFDQERRSLSVERVDDDSMIVGVKPDGSPRAPEDLKVGLDWVQTRTVNGAQIVIGQAFSFPLTVGKTWTVDFTDPTQRGRQSETHVKRTYKVIGWEDVTVPAGTFHALKIEDRGTLDARVSIPAAAAGAVTAGGGGSTAVTHIQKAASGETHETIYGLVYYVPAVKYFVKTLDEHYSADEVRVSRETEELVSFKLAAQ